MNLDLHQLSEATGAGVVRAQNWLPHIIRATDAYEINGAKRMAAFLAQIGHESGGLRFTTELWGPTPAQIGYEGRADLGNVQPGDGYKFRGHGLLQVTGRANHAAARDRLRVKLGTRVPDFEENPERLAEPEWASYSAADFWTAHGLNELADECDFMRITRRVNGGTNGYADRLARYTVAQAVLA